MTTMTHYAEQAADHRRTAAKAYRRARSDAKMAGREYARADEFARHAVWMTSHPDLWDLAGSPALWDRNAESCRRIADLFLHASFRETDNARFYNDLARKYDAMGRM